LVDKFSSYEGMFILDSNRYGRDPESVSGRLSKAIEKAGGQMLVSRLWEERRLAYPIKGHRKGTYWLTYFRLDGKNLAGLERECKLNDTVLRAIFLKVDPRIIDALVEHAKTGTTVSVRDASRPKASTPDHGSNDEDDEAASKDDGEADDTHD
jgi:small subunit ribosomal protein S6